MSEPQSPMSVGPDGEGPDPDDGHLRYLLTAYLLGDISPTGRAEVEVHLGTCRACWEEADELRQVLTLTTESLCDDPLRSVPYAFEARRLERVLGAARRRRSPRRFLVLGFAAIAACVMIAIVTPSRMRSTRGSRNGFARMGAMQARSLSLSRPSGSSVGGQHRARSLGTSRSRSRSLLSRLKGAIASDGREDRETDRSLIATRVRRLGEAPPPAPPASAPVPIAAGRPLSKTEKATDTSVDDGIVDLLTGGTGLQVREGRFGQGGGRAAPKRKAARIQLQTPGAGGRAAGDVLLAGGRRKNLRTVYESYDVSGITLPGKKAPRPRADQPLSGEPLQPGDRGGEAYKPNASRRAGIDLRVASADKDAPAKELEEAAGVYGDANRQAAAQAMEAARRAAEASAASAAGERSRLSELLARRPDADVKRNRLAGYLAAEQKLAEQEKSLNDERFAGGKPSHEADNAAVQGSIRNGLGTKGKSRSLANAAALEGELRARRYYQVPDRQRTRTLRVPPPAIGDEGLGREGFRKRYGVNPFVDTQRDHLSTFAMDVDTASYTRTRALLRAGQLPDPKAVRVEEFVNAFPDDRQADPNRVFSVYTEGAPAPFAGSLASRVAAVGQAARRGLETIKITVKARELHPGERRPAVLTLAVDVSGSMALGGRLQQVRGAIAGLLDALEPTDRVAVVVYGSEAYLALPHTPARERARILGALGAVRTGGSTNVQAGLRLAYRVADESRATGAWNRVIVCSDGVATSGAREADALLLDVRLYAKRGIDLTVLGFGRRGYNDAFLERLANRGNGNYAFCASAEEGARLFRRNLPQTLSVLARDAKIQVDFDPSVVQSYRLLGYENRDIKDADFRNDTVDAGEVGPGTQVTALYEIQRHPGAAGPLGRVFLRYRSTVTRRVEEVSFPIPPGVVAPELRSASTDLRFTACVAELAELLRESYWARDGSFADLVQELDRLRPALGGDPRWQEVRELAVRAGQLTVRRLLQQNR